MLKNKGTENTALISFKYSTMKLKIVELFAFMNINSRLIFTNWKIELLQEPIKKAAEAIAPTA